MGFCDAAIRGQLSNNPDVIPDKSPMSFVTEPPLGPRPDLIEDYGDGDQNEVEEDEIEPIIEEYDEAKCEVGIDYQLASRSDIDNLILKLPEWLSKHNLCAASLFRGFFFALLAL